MPDRRFESTAAESARSPHRSLAIGIWSTLIIADLVLIARRSAGESESSVPALLAVVSTVVVAAISWTAWSLFASSLRQGLSPAHRHVPAAISMGIAFLWAWPVAVGATLWTFGILVGIVLTQAALILAAELERFHSPVRSATANPIDTIEKPSPIERIAASIEDHQPPTDGDSGVNVESPSASASPSMSILTPFEAPGDMDQDLEEMEPACDTDENQTLWLSRRKTDEGEWIEGWVRVQLEAGQRETTVHVSFCPPLTGTPELETEDLDGAGLEIRIAAMFPFGARLSIRRTESGKHELTGRIGFAAHSTASDRAA